MKLPRKIVVFAVLFAASCFGLVVDANMASARSQTLEYGASRGAVSSLQKYLDRSRRGDLFDYRTQVYTDYFGQVTETGLKRWQAVAGHQVTGRIRIGGQQWRQLKREATAYWRASGTDARARSAARHSGWAIDASKESDRVNVLRYSRKHHELRITLSIPASFGGHIDGKFRPSTNGVWRIYLKKGPDFKSKEWHNAPMPWAAFYHGGEALHYDPLGASHGCIHIPSMQAAKYIHDRPMGTMVVVH
jgi:hypothetical protein